MKQILLDFISKYITLTNEEEDVICRSIVIRSVKKGTNLLEHGQTSDEGYFVLKGCLRTFYIVDGEEKTTGFYTVMKGVTPHCVISKKPSDYYISCVEDSVITVSNPDTDTKIFDKFPKFETLCRLMSEDFLAKQQISFDEFRISSPEQRYLNLLEKRPDLIQRVPQYQLASFLGMKPQSLSRLRARILDKSRSNVYLDALIEN